MKVVIRLICQYHFESEIMKCFALLLAFLIAVNPFISAEPIFSSNYNDDSEENSLRIASGADGKKTENLDFCWMTVNFYEKQKTCGCTILAASYIVTTARCVYEWEI